MLPNPPPSSDGENTRVEGSVSPTTGAAQRPPGTRESKRISSSRVCSKSSLPGRGTRIGRWLQNTSVWPAPTVARNMVQSRGTVPQRVLEKALGRGANLPDDLRYAILETQSMQRLSYRSSREHTEAAMGMNSAPSTMKARSSRSFRLSAFPPPGRSCLGGRMMRSK